MKSRRKSGLPEDGRPLSPGDLQWLAYKRGFRRGAVYGIVILVIGLAASFFLRDQAGLNTDAAFFAGYMPVLLVAAVALGWSSFRSGRRLADENRARTHKPPTSGSE